MGQTRKKIKEKKKLQPKEKINKEPLNQEILDSIGSPNSWTPEVENAWIAELHKLSAGEIYMRFPPMKKPPNVRKRAKGSGWGDKIVP